MNAYTNTNSRNTNSSTNLNEKRLYVESKEGRANLQKEIENYNKSFRVKLLKNEEKSELKFEKIKKVPINTYADFLKVKSGLDQGNPRTQINVAYKNLQESLRKKDYDTKQIKNKKGVDKDVGPQVALDNFRILFEKICALERFAVQHRSKVGISDGELKVVTNFLHDLYGPENTSKKIPAKSVPTKATIDTKAVDKILKKTDTWNHYTTQITYDWKSIKSNCGWKLAGCDQDVQNLATTAKDIRDNDIKLLLNCVAVSGTPSEEDTRKFKDAYNNGGNITKHDKVLVKVNGKDVKVAAHFTVIGGVQRHLHELQGQAQNLREMLQKDKAFAEYREVSNSTRYHQNSSLIKRIDHLTKILSALDLEILALQDRLETLKSAETLLHSNVNELSQQFFKIETILNKGMQNTKRNNEEYKINKKKLSEAINTNSGEDEILMAFERYSQSVNMCYSRREAERKIDRFINKDYKTKINVDIRNQILILINMDRLSHAIDTTSFRVKEDHFSKTKYINGIIASYNNCKEKYIDIGKCEEGSMAWNKWKDIESSFYGVLRLHADPANGSSTIKEWDSLKNQKNKNNKDIADGLKKIYKGFVEKESQKIYQNNLITSIGKLQGGLITEIGKLRTIGTAGSTSKNTSKGIDLTQKNKNTIIKHYYDYAKSLASLQISENAPRKMRDEARNYHFELANVVKDKGYTSLWAQMNYCTILAKLEVVQEKIAQNLVNPLTNDHEFVELCRILQNSFNDYQRLSKPKPLPFFIINKVNGLKTSMAQQFEDDCNNKLKSINRALPQLSLNKPPISQEDLKKLQKPRQTIEQPKKPAPPIPLTFSDSDSETSSEIEVIEVEVPLPVVTKRNNSKILRVENLLKSIEDEIPKIKNIKNDKKIFVLKKEQLLGEFQKYINEAKLLKKQDDVDASLKKLMELIDIESNTKNKIVKRFFESLNSELKFLWFLDIKSKEIDSVLNDKAWESLSLSDQELKKQTVEFERDQYQDNFKNLLVVTNKNLEISNFTKTKFDEYKNKVQILLSKKTKVATPLNITTSSHSDPLHLSNDSILIIDEDSNEDTNKTTASSYRPPPENNTLSLRNSQRPLTDLTNFDEEDLPFDDDEFSFLYDKFEKPSAPIVNGQLIDDVKNEAEKLEQKILEEVDSFVSGTQKNENEIINLYQQYLTLVDNFSNTPNRQYAEKQNMHGINSKFLEKILSNLKDKNLRNSPLYNVINTMGNISIETAKLQVLFHFEGDEARRLENISANIGAFTASHTTLKFYFESFTENKNDNQINIDPETDKAIVEKYDNYFALYKDIKNIFNNKSSASSASSSQPNIPQQPIISASPTEIEVDTSNDIVHHKIPTQQDSKIPEVATPDKVREKVMNGGKLNPEELSIYINLDKKELDDPKIIGTLEYVSIQKLEKSIGELKKKLSTNYPHLIPLLFSKTDLKNIHYKEAFIEDLMVDWARNNAATGDVETVQVASGANGTEATSETQMCLDAGALVEDRTQGPGVLLANPKAATKMIHLAQRFGITTRHKERQDINSNGHNSLKPIGIVPFNGYVTYNTILLDKKQKETKITLAYLKKNGNEILKKLAERIMDGRKEILAPVLHDMPVIAERNKVNDNKEGDITNTYTILKDENPGKVTPVLGFAIPFRRGGDLPFEEPYRTMAQVGTLLPSYHNTFLTGIFNWLQKIDNIMEADKKAGTVTPIASLPKSNIHFTEIGAGAFGNEIETIHWVFHRTAQKYLHDYNLHIDLIGKKTFPKTESEKETCTKNKAIRDNLTKNLMEKKYKPVGKADIWTKLDRDYGSKV